MRRDRTAFPGVARLLRAALALCAVVLAPVGVSLTHPPVAAALEADAFARDHGAARVLAGDSGAGHDASDHEQQVRLLPVRAAGNPVTGREGVAPSDRSAPPSAIREGPTRPPRLV